MTYNKHPQFFAEAYGYSPIFLVRVCFVVIKLNIVAHKNRSRFLKRNAVFFFVDIVFRTVPHKFLSVRLVLYITLHYIHISINLSARNGIMP